MRLEIVYVAALGLLLKQMRERAPAPEMLASAHRLVTLAHVGSVTIDDVTLDDAAAVEVAAEEAALVRMLMRAHGLSAIDIASTVTEPELLKIGALLTGAPSEIPGAIVESAEALAIWNVRLRVPGLALRPTPIGMRSIPEAGAVGVGGSHGEAPTPRAVPEPVTAPAKVPGAPAGGGDTLEQALTKAMRGGDGGTVFRLLAAVTDPRAFEQVATADVLQVLVEHLLDQPPHHEAVRELLARAGVAGARAVFGQLVAATELADRRLLYDVAASLPATLVVAQEHANDPTWYVARNAAGLLGESGSQAAVADLARLLRHHDTRVRVAAVAALGQIGGPAAMARLESLFFDQVADVRNRALAIVFAAPETDPLADRLMLTMQEESSLEHQLEIIGALSHVHTPRARNKLVELTQARSQSLEDLQIRLAAIGALAHGHRPAADDVLRRLTSDEHSIVRDRAAAALST